MKRLLSFVLCLILVVESGCAASAEPSQAGIGQASAVTVQAVAQETLSSVASQREADFRDVPGNAWYAEAVAYAQSHGLMDGVGGGNFDPNGKLSRAMMVTVLYRAAGEPAVSGRSGFSDVRSGAWYDKAIAWAQENDIVNGYNAVTFGVNDPLTREQMAAILWRYAGRPSAESVEEFTDADSISGWAKEAVAWAKENSVINGVGGNRFDPKGTASRAQLAQVLMNGIENKIIILEEREETPTEEPEEAPAEEPVETPVSPTPAPTSTPEQESLEDNVVRVSAGLLRGNKSNDVVSYLGVPYAEATERFVPASPVASWQGIKDAANYGKISYQGTVVGIAGSNGSNNDNNCQNLNIWTPGIRDGEKRAVMVWLHGGGFSTGSANESTYNGANLAKSQNVVVVGVNHRLNVFGHLDLSAYGEKYRYSANVGIDDIVKALQWIRDNIEQFGGDPDNVTVFGQSGGGAKVLSLMTSPNAKGLFHKGIVMSGATEIMGISFSSKEVSQRIAKLTLQNLDISPNNLDALQTVSYSELFSASDRAREQAGREFGILAALSTEYGVEWGPVIEGDYMPTNPVTETGFADAGKGIPLLIGSTFSEWTHWRSIVMHSNMTQAQRDAFAAAYPDRPASDAQYVDTFIRLPMLKIMSHKVDQGGANVYAYVFNYGSDPYHGYDIPYAFGNTSGSVATAMSTAFANFAKTGTPSASGLPTWEPYSRENGATMILNTTSRLVYNHDKELMSLLEPNYRY